MKVKIGNRIYDPNVQPILLILDETTKELISSMPSENYKLCLFPEDYSISEIERFMADEPDLNQLDMFKEFNIPVDKVVE